MTTPAADIRTYSTNIAPAGAFARPTKVASLPDLSDEMRLKRLKKFKFRAVIDFIVLEVRSSRPTQARHLHGRLPPEWGAYVMDVESQPDIYIVRVNDPPLDVAEIRTSLASAGVDLSTPIRIRTMEVSLDAHPVQDFCETDAVELAYETATTFGRRLTDQRTVTRVQGRIDTEFEPTSSELFEHFQQGRTCYNGNREDAIFFRTYIKKTDRHRPLPESEFRVRHEVHLRDPKWLPKTLDDLASYEFEGLTELFPVFREHLTVVEPYSLRAATRRKLTELTPMLSQRWPTPKRRAKSRQLRNYPKIQERRVYEPLRRLGHRIIDSERP